MARSGAYHSTGTLFAVAFLGGGTWQRLGFAGARALLFTWLVMRGGHPYDQLLPLLAMILLLPGAGGLVVERIGPRAGMVAGALLEAAGMGLLGLGLIAPAAVGLGVGGALLQPAVFAAAPGTGRRDAMFTLLYVGGATGAFAVPMLALALAQALGWGWGCGAAAAASLAAAVVAAASRPRGHTVPPDREAPAPAVDEDQLDTMPPADRMRVYSADTGGVTAPMHEREAAPVLVEDQIVYSGASPVALGPRAPRVAERVVLIAIAAVFWLGFERVGIPQLALAHGGLTSSSLWALAVNPVVLAVGGPLLMRLWLRVRPPVHLLLAGGMALLGASLGLTLVPGAGSAAWFVVTAAELLVVPVGLGALVALSPREHAARWVGLWLATAGVGALLGYVLWSTLGGDVSAVVAAIAGGLAALALALRPVGRLLVL